MRFIRGRFSHSPVYVPALEILSILPSLFVLVRFRLFSYWGIYYLVDSGQLLPHGPRGHVLGAPPRLGRVFGSFRALDRIFVLVSVLCVGVVSSRVRRILM